VKFGFRCNESIPALAWCLTIADGRASLVHGPMVEATPEFFTDGVWDGRFEDHRFDQRFFAGTGGIVRSDRIVLVGSSAPVDRVFVSIGEGKVVASNSLPFILVVLEDKLDSGDLSYRNRLMAVEDGVHIAPKWIRTATGRRLRLLYDETASVSSRGVRVSRRPPYDDFRDFAHYRDTLQATVSGLFENAQSIARSVRFDPTVSLSAGYDSVAVATLGAHAGMRDALTLRRPSPDDSSVLLDHLVPLQMP